MQHSFPRPPHSWSQDDGGAIQTNEICFQTKEENETKHNIMALDSDTSIWGWVSAGLNLTRPAVPIKLPQWRLTCISRNAPESIPKVLDTVALDASACGRRSPANSIRRRYEGGTHAVKQPYFDLREAYHRLRTVGCEEEHMQSKSEKIRSFATYFVLLRLLL
ncbi:hypothetical protein OG21DRAFT_84548 [Imleria badia]|nr:hypothetical protein OG21DRAFT_84548 [Imleria badia]